MLCNRINKGNIEQNKFYRFRSVDEQAMNPSWRTWDIVVNLAQAQFQNNAVICYIFIIHKVIA